MPRMAATAENLVRLKGGFNGASASMPRMVAKAGKVRRAGAKLQRGLGIDAEDGDGSFAVMKKEGMLQRGLGIDAEDGRPAA